MINIYEYLLSKNKLNTIFATNENIRKIVKNELDKCGHDAELNHIDVSQVTNMDSLFSCYEGDYLEPEYEDLNPDVFGWDVRNVKSMYGTFYECHNFNHDLSGWDVRNVEDMRCMFSGCKRFDCDLSKWKVRKVACMDFMFWGCENFNHDLSKWDVSNIKQIRGMFEDCPIKEEFKPKFKD